jgi:hypothetical protein
MSLLMVKKTRQDLQRDAVAKDKREVIQKRWEYDGFMDWRDRGIVYDLAQMHNVTNPALSLLLPIATAMSARIGVALGRQEKRRRDLLIGWINKHYDQICGYIPRLVFRDETGGMIGACVDEWKRYHERNPAEDIAKYLN